MNTLLLLAIVAIIALVLPNLYRHFCEDKKQEIDVKANASVEQIVAADREYMFANYGGNYHWYETSVVLKHYLDANEQNGDVELITNVFQVIKEKDGGADTFVVQISHCDGECEIIVLDGFWVEDFALNEKLISISFLDAYYRVMSVNYPKPHSRQCVLRSQVGAKEANAQYIFGNQKLQLYVDSFTGNVTDKNPVF